MYKYPTQQHIEMEVFNSCCAVSGKQITRQLFIKFFKYIHISEFILYTYIYNTMFNLYKCSLYSDNKPANL